MFVTPKKSSYNCPPNAPKKKAMKRWPTWVLDAIPPFPNLDTVEVEKVKRVKEEPTNMNEETIEERMVSLNISSLD